jgi:hypothetical protein
MAGPRPPAGSRLMTGNVAFLMKDLVLLATSIYLLTQDVTEQALAAAGFVMKLGDTPDKLANLRGRVYYT